MGPVIPYGTWKSTCPGEAKKSGADRPFTVTVAPASESGSGKDDAGEAVSVARLEPIRLADIPGASGTCAKLAELTNESTRGTLRARAPCTIANAPRPCVAATS